jgi:hypothetical protein
MCLVDHQQPEPARQRVQHPPSEARVRQPFGRDQQHVDLVAHQGGLDLTPRVDVRRVQGGCRQAGTRGRRHLVAHQRQQR